MNEKLEEVKASKNPIYWKDIENKMIEMTCDNMSAILKTIEVIESPEIAKSSSSDSSDSSSEEETKEEIITV